MYLLNKESKELEKIEEITFSSEGIKERNDLQEWIDNDISILGEELLVIQKEFSGFIGTNERLDLLALDKNGNLVLIENKLDDSGKDVVWQALKYVSYCASMSKTDIIHIYQEYLDNKGEKSSAHERLCAFFNKEIDEIQLNIGNNQRIILIAKKFRREVTSLALWLLEKGIDIQCIKVMPYKLNSDIVIDIDRIIPIPEVEDYMIKMSKKDEQNKIANKTQIANQNTYFEYWTKLKDFFSYKNSNFYKDRTPPTESWWPTFSGIGSVNYNLVLRKSELRVELYINKKEKVENKKIFDFLYLNKEKIECNFCYELKWERLDDKKASRISYSSIDFNFDKDDKEKWDEAIKWHYDYLNKLYKSIQDDLSNYK